MNVLPPEERVIHFQKEVFDSWWNGVIVAKQQYAVVTEAE